MTNCPPRTKPFRMRKLLYAILTIHFIVAFSGCVGAPPRSGGGVSSAGYVELSSLASRNGLTWQWDGFSSFLRVRDVDDDVKLYPGSRIVLHNQRKVDLGAPVKIRDGKVMVPANFAALFGAAKKLPPFPQKPSRETFVTISRVVIDAGHGGKDPGAVGAGGIQEKDIVLDVALRLKRQLEAAGITVILTRSRDEFLTLGQRSDIANRNQADFFISVHANAAHNRFAHGFEAFYLSTEHDDFAKAVQIRENAAVRYEDSADYEFSNNLNATLWDMILTENRIESIEMANSVSFELSRMLNLKTRYIRGANFYVLKGAKMPAVLLEIGYVSNAREGARLNNPHYRQMLSEAIASGILRYKGQVEKTNGFTR